MSATALETKQRPWWLTLIGGILAFVIGAVLLWAPTKTAAETWVLLIQFLGIYWLVAGIMDIISLFVDHTAWGWKLFMGIVSIIAASYILMYPVASGFAMPKIIVLVLGIWGIVQGVILLVLAFKGGGWGAGILGVLAIIFGLILAANYYKFGVGAAMVWVLALTGVVGGIIMIVQSFRMRSALPG
jgi:uncharacterized membrane protein HdeD (DUF308 family)